MKFKLRYTLGFLPFLLAFMLKPSSVHQISNEKELPFFLRESPQWALEKLESLSLREKIAQSFMVATYPNKGESHFLEIDRLVEEDKIGGLIYFQGNRNQLQSHMNRIQSKAQVPLLFGMDAEWGSAMRLSDEQRFPYALTLGAADSPEYTSLIAEAMGEEMRELGIHLNFAPVIDVNSNPNNPVIGFRSFGENALKVGLHGNAMIKGMEKYNVLTCMKHFPGHGDTDLDSHFDLPSVNKSLMELDVVDWTPFKMGRLSGASAIMMAHLNVPALDSSGTPSSLSKIIIQEILIKRLKFSGLIISDALNMKAVSDRYGKVEVAKMAYIAGNDILLYPEDVTGAITAIENAVINGEISEAEVNQKCMKVLRAKYYAVIKKLTVKPINPFDLENAKHRIYERAITVLKNNQAIPLRRMDTKVALITLGSRSTSFSNMANEYGIIDTFYAVNGDEAISRFGDTLGHYPQIMVNVHAKSMLPRNGFGYPEKWEDFIQKLPKESNVVITFFGNPYILRDFEDLTNADAIIAAYENHPLAQEWAAQLVFGAYSSTGKLPVTLNAKMQVDFGIVTPLPSRLKFTQPEEMGISREKLAQIDSIAIRGIREEAYPGCQIIAAKDGKVFYRKSFGHLTYDKAQQVNHQTVYDLASITKVASSTLSLMALNDSGKFSLDSTLNSYIPGITRASVYGKTKLKDMMTHQAGFAPWIPFYTKTLVNGKLKPELYSITPNDSMSLKVADSIYILNSYEDSIIRKILMTPLKTKTYKYSDLGYYFVKQIIQQQSEKNLDVFAKWKFYAPMGLKSTRYNPLEYYPRLNIAPTEKDNYYRNQTVHGYVHDMGAAMQGGVGGHAGLFSNATDLAALMQMLLNNGLYGGERYLSEEVIQQYTSCQYCPGNRRGAGFDKPVRSLDGGPTCNRVSLKSYGHSGFTGTQVWADPEHGINYVFLSNRTYPSAENNKLLKLGTRTEIQRVIYEAILDK